MSPFAAMERQAVEKPGKVRIEKPEISVYPASVPKPAADASSRLGWTFLSLMILSYLFSASILYLVFSAF